MSGSRAPSVPKPISIDRLVSVIGEGAEISGDPATLISGIAYDSRRVTGGDLFCAIPGFEIDGHEFVPDATQNGAAAAIVERWVEGVDLPQVKVAAARPAMAIAAAEFFGHPSNRICLAGVTGTNGKTSTAFMIERIFREAGYLTGLTGTVETRLGNTTEPVTRTTPEAPDLQALLWRMAEAGVEYAAMEVSSHALTLDRVLGTEFKVGVFTNLSQDHLDFHETMEDYYRSKRRLFETSMTDSAVLNAEDPWSLRVIEDLRSLSYITFGTERSSGASIWADEIELRPDGSEFMLRGTIGPRKVEMHLRGGFAVLNAVAAAGAAHLMGASEDEIAAGLGAVEAIPGRFEPVDRGQSFLAVVDYAHTPDAVTAVVEAARALCNPGGRVIIVIGCGGDRDRSKRPLMAAAAVRGSDHAIFTSDNPRSEDPLKILDEMTAGLSRAAGDEYDVVEERRAAIRAAIRLASAGDVVLIAGKGHESGQSVGSETRPFDDRVVLGEELEAITDAEVTR